MNPTITILNLARSFPILRHKLATWNPTVFEPDEFYRMSRPWSHGEQIAVKFVLEVWNSQFLNKHGDKFDLKNLGQLDFPDREIIAAWILNPVYP